VPISSVIVPPFFAAAGVAVPPAELSPLLLLLELDPHAATTIAITTGRASLFTTRLLSHR
jgi:hypothetical protein